MKSISKLITLLFLINCGGTSDGDTVFGGTGDGETDFDGDEDLLASASQALETWQAEKAINYSYDIQNTGFLPDSDRTVTVQCGVVLPWKKMKKPSHSFYSISLNSTTKIATST